jgi:hypothetical protein
LLCGCSVRKNRKKRYEEVAERMKKDDSGGLIKKELAKNLTPVIY